MGGAKGHGPRIAPSLHHSLKEQSSRRRGHLSLTALFLLQSQSPPTGHKSSPSLHPGSITGSHRALRRDGKHVRGSPAVCNSHVHTHAGTETELCPGPQPNPNLEDSEHLAWGCPGVTLLRAAAELKPLQLTKCPSCPPRKEKS